MLDRRNGENTCLALARLAALLFFAAVPGEATAEVECRHTNGAPVSFDTWCQSGTGKFRVERTEYVGLTVEPGHESF